MQMRQLRFGEIKELSKVTELIIHRAKHKPDSLSEEQTWHHCPLLLGGKGKFTCPLAGPPGVRDQVGACVVSPGIHCRIHLELIKAVGLLHFLTWFGPEELNIFMWRLSPQAPGLCCGREVPLLLLPPGSPVTCRHLWGGGARVGVVFSKWGLLCSFVCFLPPRL